MAVERIHLCELGGRLELCGYIRFALGNAWGQARIKILAEHFIWATIVWCLSFPNAALLLLTSNSKWNEIEGMTTRHSLTWNTTQSVHVLKR